MNLFRTRFEAQNLPGCGASGLEVDSVLCRSPVVANNGGKGFGGVLLHG
jgi:hypothetical protein